MQKIVKKNNLVMALLQSNSQRCEAVLRGKGLAGSRGEQEPNHLVMVLLQTPTLLYWDTADGSGSGLIWRKLSLVFWFCVHRKMFSCHICT